MKIVYMAHPVSGDVKNNLVKAKAWVRWIEENNPDVAVVASWITECEIWDDDNPTHRAAGLKRDLAVIERCDELWLVGSKVSEGMQRERSHAEEHGLIIRDLTTLCRQWPPGYVRQLTDKNVIWSRQWSSWWRARGSGYTTELFAAGLYTREEAEAYTKHLGPEKGVEVMSWVEAWRRWWGNGPGANTVGDALGFTSEPPELETISREAQAELPGFVSREAQAELPGFVSREAQAELPGFASREARRAKPAAVVGYVREGDRILVRMRAGENDAIAGAYECPGGMAHAGESLLDALAREVREESGLVVEGARLLEVFDSPRAVVFLYRIAVSGEPRTEPGKEPWQWLTQSEAVERSLTVPSALMNWLGKNQGLDRPGVELGRRAFERYPAPVSTCLAQEPGFEPVYSESLDPTGRRNVWIRGSSTDIELCAGREGDDAYVRLRLLYGTIHDLDAIFDIAADLWEKQGAAGGVVTRIDWSGQEK